MQLGVQDATHHVEMMAHHVFNRPEDGLEIYWMEQCVQHCHSMLTETFGIDASEITYVENPWCGGGNAGAAVEVIVGGLELATLVFMDMEEHPDGDVELKGDRYRTMPLQIIDTGYGLERFCWAAAGTPTIYEAIYPETVAWLKELSGFESVANQWPSLDLDRLLSEMSRLNGIMNIEAGVDGDMLVNIFLTVLVSVVLTFQASNFHPSPSHWPTFTPSPTISMRCAICSAMVWCPQTPKQAIWRACSLVES